MSDKVGRQLSHCRRIECVGYRRDDGLWDIEAKLEDAKGFRTQTIDRDDIPLNDYLHEMTMVLVIDQAMKIHEVQVDMTKTPYRLCKEIESAYQQLVGLTIGPGWHQKTRALFAGVSGCTHLYELLTPIATTAFQVVVDDCYRHNPDQQMHPMLVAPINNCHGLADTGYVVEKLWPQKAKVN